MTRRERLLTQAHKERSVSEELAFQRGVEWADNNPKKPSLMDFGDISIYQKPDRQTETKKAEVNKDNYKNKYGLLSPSLEEAEKAIRFIEENQVQWLWEEEQDALNRLLKALTNPAETRLFIDCESLDEFEDFWLAFNCSYRKCISLLKIYRNSLILLNCFKVAENIDMIIEACIRSNDECPKGEL